MSSKAWDKQQADGYSGYDYDVAIPADVLKTLSTEEVQVIFDRANGPGEITRKVDVGFVCTNEPGVPHTASARKQTPVASGVLAYFPDAIAEVAKVSFIGNAQHNPGQPLHWARGKSTDQLDAAVRHIMDYLKGVRRDERGNNVLAQAAWRILAQAQLDVEGEQGK